MSLVPSGQHLAAIIPSQGSRFEVAYRTIPTPGPNELLIEVKAIALNPVDYFQRDSGFMITEYPAVVGSDVAGIVISVGSSVVSRDLTPGTRVTAFASAFFQQGNPDYSALQKLVIVPAENVTSLPDGISFTEGSILPMAIATAWSGYYVIGIPRDTKYAPAEKKGLLLWGGASSVGSAALQVAKSMGFVIYATASEKHHEYLKTLGASRVFDYKKEDVVQRIIKAAKDDGVTIEVGYDAVAGAFDQCIEVLKGAKGNGIAKLACATSIPENFQAVDWAEVKWVSPPEDADTRTEHFHFIFNVWLKAKLASGEFVPSPKVQVVPGGLKGANEALDEIKKGVSGVKLVLEV